MRQIAIKDSLQLFLADISEYPVLSREEEYELALKVHGNNDLDAARKLINSNLRFVIKISREYLSYGLPLMDLVQEGAIGLMQAVRKFDPHRGTRLITYAVWWIKARIHGYIMKSWSMVKIGTTQSQRKLFQKISRARKRLSIEGEQLGIEDTQRLAEDLGVSTEDIEQMNARTSQRDLSIDSRTGDTDSVAMVEILEDGSPIAEELVGDAEVSYLTGAGIEQGFELLNERERYIIEQRFYSDPPVLLRELSDTLGISKERVRQIESNALGKMRRPIEQRLGTGTDTRA